MLVRKVKLNDFQRKVMDLRINQSKYNESDYLIPATLELKNYTLCLNSFEAIAKQIRLLIPKYKMPNIGTFNNTARDIYLIYFLINGDEDIFSKLGVKTQQFLSDNISDNMAIGVMKLLTGMIFSGTVTRKLSNDAANYRDTKVSNITENLNDIYNAYTGLYEYCEQATSDNSLSVNQLKSYSPDIMTSASKIATIYLDIVELIKFLIDFYEIIPDLKSEINAIKLEFNLTLDNCIVLKKMATKLNR